MVIDGNGFYMHYSIDQLCNLLHLEVIGKLQLEIV